MVRWSFLSSHARVLLCIARDPAVRLRDLAASLNMTERSAHGIVTDLAEAGYVIKLKQGRRNSYQVQTQVPVSVPGSREPPVGELLTLFAARVASSLPEMLPVPVVPMVPGVPPGSAEAGGVAGPAGATNR
jgi:hypothetical protein